LEISESANVLVVEDSLDRIKRFRSWLPNARLAATAPKAIAKIQEDCPEIVFLDRDLVQSFGEDEAEFLSKERFAGRVFVTSANRSAPR
jgi:CheY-like chemotaxis protein